MSAPRATILMASSGNGRCSALASSHGAHPNVPFPIGRQDHRHRLWMDRLDNGVRCRRQETVDEMKSTRYPFAGRRLCLLVMTGHVGAVAFSRTGDPAAGDFNDAKVIRKFGDVPDNLSAR